jgi:hypothetical protein
LRSFVPPAFPSYLVAAVAAAPAGAGGSDGAGAGAGAVAAVAAVAAAVASAAWLCTGLCWFPLPGRVRLGLRCARSRSFGLVWAHLPVSNTRLVNIIIEKLTFIIQIINLEKNN